MTPITGMKDVRVKYIRIWSFKQNLSKNTNPKLYIHMTDEVPEPDLIPEDKKPTGSTDDPRIYLPIPGNYRLILLMMGN